VLALSIIFWVQPDFILKLALVQKLCPIKFATTPPHDIFGSSTQITNPTHPPNSSLIDPDAKEEGDASNDSDSQAGTLAWSEGVTASRPWGPSCPIERSSKKELYPYCTSLIAKQIAVVVCFRIDMGVIKHPLQCLNHWGNLSPSSHTFREEVRLFVCSLEVGL
jgi:hypothetical protein